MAKQSTRAELLDKYNEKYGAVEIASEQTDDDITLIHIDTQRLTATSLYSKNDKYDDFSDNLKQLHKVTFGDAKVVETFADGKVFDNDAFAAVVNRHSLRTKHSYKFVGFIVEEKDPEDQVNSVVGYEVLNNCCDLKKDQFMNNTAEVAYLMSGSKQGRGVGSEAVGAMLLHYGYFLYDENVFINQIFDEKEQKFTGGTKFTKCYATARQDNEASAKILEKYGFCKTGAEKKYDAMRDVFIKDYEAESYDGIGPMGGHIIGDFFDIG